MAIWSRSLVLYILAHVYTTGVARPGPEANVTGLSLGQTGTITPGNESDLTTSGYLRPAGPKHEAATARSDSGDPRTGGRQTASAEASAGGTSPALLNETTTEEAANNGSEKWRERERIHVVEFNFEGVSQPLCLCIVIVLSALLQTVLHHVRHLSIVFPESCILLLVGIIAGAVIHYADPNEYVPHMFSPEEFFLALLPPIVLAAAYSLNNRIFFENVGVVLLFAVGGTVVACFLIGPTLYGLVLCGAINDIPPDIIQIFVFSSLIVAVDPVAVLAVFTELNVNKVLYTVVFGESLLNDGVTVVLYRVMQSYNKMDVITHVDILMGIAKFFVVSCGGFMIGVVVGMISAFVSKFTKGVKVVEPIIVFGLAYFAYLVAELFELSGIISMIGCGLVQSQYAFHNIHQKSRSAIKFFSKVISTSSEVVIFVFLGLALFRNEHDWRPLFITFAIASCLIYRFLIVYIMTFFINKFSNDRVRRFGLREQFIMAYGGLRGAVAFSLVLLLRKDEVPLRMVFVTTTLMVVLFSVFFQGITIKPFMKIMKVKLAMKKTYSLLQTINDKFLDELMSGIEPITGRHGRYYWKVRLEYYDKKYLKRFLQNNPAGKDVKMKQTFEKIVKTELQQSFNEPARLNMVLNIRNPSERENESLEGIINGGFDRSLDKTKVKRRKFRTDELREILEENPYRESYCSDPGSLNPDSKASSLRSVFFQDDSQTTAEGGHWEKVTSFYHPKPNKPENSRDRTATEPRPTRENGDVYLVVPDLSRRDRSRGSNPVAVEADGDDDMKAGDTTAF